MRLLQQRHCHYQNDSVGPLSCQRNFPWMVVQKIIYLGDNIEGFIRAIKYLNRTEQKTSEEIQQMVEQIFNE